jgi:alpha-mannosidase
VRVVTDLRLDAGTDFLTCVIRGANHRRNHRLQLVWNTGVQAAAILADAAFGPVWRTPIHPAPNTREAVPAGMPMHRWIAVADHQRGVTLCADGLAEAEVQEGRMALTLLRAIGQLSKSALPERPGHAGWPAATPEAQSIGPFAARCAIRFHGPIDDRERGRIRDMADDVLLPLVGDSWRDLSPATHHASFNGPQLHGEGLEASAVTIAQEDPLAIVLRAVNLTESPVTGHWELPDAGPWEVTPCRMDETPIADTHATNERIPLALPPRGVATVRVRRAIAVPAIPHPA